MKLLSHLSLAKLSKKGDCFQANNQLKSALKIDSDNKEITRLRKRIGQNCINN